MNEETFEISVKGARMSARTMGAGEPFVLIHGIPGAGVNWSAVGRRLASAGFLVIIPDLVGFGDSSRARDIDQLDLSFQSSMVSALLESKGITNFHLAGHDYGGPIAVTLMSLRPGTVRTLGILSSNLLTTTPIPFPLSLVRNRLIGRLATRILFSRKSLSVMLKRGVSKTSSPLNANEYLGDAEQTAAIASIFYHSLLEISTRYSHVEQCLGTISVPVTVVWGSEDPFIPTEIGLASARMIATATFSILSGAGHFLPEEQPARVAASLIANARRAYIAS